MRSILTLSTGSMLLKSLPPWSGLRPAHLWGHWLLCERTASSRARPYDVRLFDDQYQQRFHFLYTAFFEPSIHWVV
jgi:hypothetical protein